MSDDYLFSSISRPCGVYELIRGPLLRAVSFYFVGDVMDETPLLLFSSPSDRPLLPPLGPRHFLSVDLIHQPIHWLGEDGKNVFVEVQGQCVCVAFRKGPGVAKPALRGLVFGFSPASRLRLLKLVNRLSWERAGRCTFLTLTWHDSVGRPEPKRLTQARSDFHRRLEKECDIQTSGLWRVEWELRERGRFRGQYMPHVHVILFGVPWLCRQKLRDHWTRAIGSSKESRVHLEEIQNLRKCMYYVSKYIAKLSGLSCLVIPSYLNIHLAGRKWGVYRKHLLPLGDKDYFRTMPGELIEEIRRIARQQWEGVPLNPESGFTVFGPAAEKIRALIVDWTGRHQGEFDRLHSRSEGDATP